VCWLQPYTHIIIIIIIMIMIMIMIYKTPSCKMRVY
jgi:hypothetical protein